MAVSRRLEQAKSVRCGILGLKPRWPIRRRAVDCLEAVQVQIPFPLLRRVPMIIATGYRRVVTGTGTAGRIPTTTSVDRGSREANTQMSNGADTALETIGISAAASKIRTPPKRRSS